MKTLTVNVRPERYNLYDEKTQKAVAKRRKEQLYALYQAKLAKERGEIVSFSYVIGQDPEYRNNEGFVHPAPLGEPLFSTEG